MFFLLPVTEGKPSLDKRLWKAHWDKHGWGWSMGGQPHFQSQLFNELSLLMTTSQNYTTEARTVLFLAFCPAVKFSPGYYPLKIHKLGFQTDECTSYEHSQTSGVAFKRLLASRLTFTSFIRHTLCGVQGDPSLSKTEKRGYNSQESQHQWSLKVVLQKPTSTPTIQVTLVKHSGPGLPGFSGIP